MPLDERLRRLVETLGTPTAAFTRNGVLVGASESARSLLGHRNLADMDLARMQDHALSTGHAEATIDIGHVALQRIGSGSDVGLIATITPVVMPAPPHEDRTSPVPIAPPGPKSDEVPMSSEETLVDLNFSVDEPLQTAPLADERATRTQENEAAAEPEARPVADSIEIPEPIRPHAFGHEEADVADATVATPPTEAPAADHVARNARTEPSATAAPALDAVLPVRFVWQMDAEGRFLLGSDDFMRLIGPRTAGEFGRPWREIVAVLDLDPHGLVEKAVATHETWSGITLNWPVDDHGPRLPVELSGLPVFDRSRSFAGYRGFGVCRDLARLSDLSASQRAMLPHDLPVPRPLAADVPDGPAPGVDHAPPPSLECTPSPVEAPPCAPTVSMRS